MTNNVSSVLWIGFRTLQSLQEGCLSQKNVTLTNCSTFEQGLTELSTTPHDIVVLSLSARGERLREQLAGIRERVPRAFIAAIVCHDTDVEDAARAGADDVMSLEGEGDLVRAPVLRWIELSRAGVGKLIDLRATTRTRNAVERERDHLRTEVDSLRRHVLRDPASNALGREAFVGQLELATTLLGPSAGNVDLLVFELPALPGDWTEDLMGGCMSHVVRTLSEVAGRSAVIGRVGRARFAVFLVGISENDAAWLSSVASDRLREISAPLLGDLRVTAMNCRIRCSELIVPARLVLEEMEEELAQDMGPTRILRTRVSR